MRYHQCFVTAVLIVGLLAPTTSPAFASISTIEVPGATYTSANGMNDRGDIVGNYSEGWTYHGFVLHNGTFTTIDVPGTIFTDARGINNRGEIVGRYTLTLRTFHGFVLDKGTFTSFDVPGATSTEPSGMNDRGEIVGNFVSGGTGTTHSFALDKGTFTTIIDVFAPGINNCGEIVGGTGRYGLVLH